MLTLKDAIQHDKLDEFIRQEEARGVEPADSAELGAAMEAVIQQQSKNQTLRSPSRGGSTGK